MSEHHLILHGGSTDMQILADIIRRRVGIDPLSPQAAIDADTAPNLELWEKVHVLQAAWNHAINLPCLVLMMIAGVTHAQADEAMARQEAIQTALAEPAPQGTPCQTN